MSEPIIVSLLDADFYKFTMGQFVLKRFPNVPVRYEFKNRTKRVLLGKFVSEEDLRKELDAVRDLRFRAEELEFLRRIETNGKRLFSEDYLLFLKDLELPPYDLKHNGETIELSFSGSWREAIYWETLALSIANELYYRSAMKKMTAFEKDAIFAEGTVRLAEKIRLLKENPEIVFSDFGTRRRFSRLWHDYAVTSLAAELPKTQFIGTSNVYLAMKHGLKPVGTMAHELFMAAAAISGDGDEQIRQSHNDVLKTWREEYGEDLSIALTDTFGSEFFFNDMTEEQARNWKGLRQDSGSPTQFGEKAIQFYREKGVDFRQKTIVFSDGLDINTILMLYRQFNGRVKCVFGWGTNLTNDLGLGALSLVVKVVEANGRGTVKLSDNPAKATGKPEDVHKYKRIFGYAAGEYKECKY